MEKKKGGKFKVVLIVIAAFLVISALVGGTNDANSTDNTVSTGNNNNIKTTQNKEESANKGSEATKKESEATKKEKQEEEEKILTVGDSTELKDVIVTFNSVTESEGSDFNMPTDGNVFVLAEFTIENNSDKEISMSTVLSFDAYQDGFATSLSLQALLEKGNSEQLDGSIAPGKKMKGVVGYEIPKDYSELEINVQLNVWSSKKLTFVYSK